MVRTVYNIFRKMNLSFEIKKYDIKENETFLNNVCI